MLTLVAFVHIGLALILILFVLLQDSKGGAMGVFSSGGASNSMFGSSGGGDILVKVTKWLAIGFAATCVGLAYMTSNTGDSVLDQVEAGPTQEAGASKGEDQKVIDTTKGAAAGDEKTSQQDAAQETPSRSDNPTAEGAVMSGDDKDKDATPQSQ